MWKKIILYVLVLSAVFAESTDEDPITSLKCVTTQGDITIVLNKLWAPIGVTRFLELVDDEFFTEQPLYRAIDDFLVQFGIHAEPEVNDKWEAKGTIADDPDLNLQFKFGVLSFAGGGPRTRDTSVFFATSMNPNQLDHFGTEVWERPLGYVTTGRHLLMSFYNGYGDMAEQGGKGPSQRSIRLHGYLHLKHFPRLDWLRSCERVETTEADRKEVDLNNWQRKNQEDPIDVTFINRGDEPMDLYFQPASGKFVFIQTLQVGEHVEESTFTSHTYLWTRHEQKVVVRISRMEAHHSTYAHVLHDAHYKHDEL